MSYGIPNGIYQPNQTYYPQMNSVQIQTSGVQITRNVGANARTPNIGRPYSNAGRIKVGAGNGNWRGEYRRPYYNGGYSIPNIANNTSYGRDEIVSRLQYLQQVRSGLIAQWNQLDDEARRTGVRID